MLYKGQEVTEADFTDEAFQRSKYYDVAVSMETLLYGRKLTPKERMDFLVLDIKPEIDDD